MAKTSGPLMSLDASGSFAKTLTYAKWKGRNYVRHLVTPSNPQSVGQQTARGALGSAGRVNSHVEFGSAAQLSLNAAAPSGQSGVSFYAKKQISLMAASLTDYANVTYATQKGYFDTAAAAIGLGSLIIPGETPLTISGGGQLWNAYQAMFTIDDSLATTTSRTATADSISDFTDSLEA